MNKFRIYQPARNAMQSGKKNTKKWLMVPITENIRSISEITGWTSASNTSSQLKYEFATKEDAINFATKSGFEYEVVTPNSPSVKQKSYAANFTS